tara:strand:+ start:364 stop:996 length:633 start_codon:yes stop_codon:yes gene_type:complete
MNKLEKSTIENSTDPTCTALLLVECQNGVIGEGSSFPALAEEAALIIPSLAQLVKAARGANIKVIHGLALIRNDAWGASRNARLFGAARKSPVQQLPESRETEPIPEIGFYESSDILLPRFQGLSPTSGTELKSLLRNEGISNVVVCGVSLNIAIQNCVFDLVNDAFNVLVPVDAVAGVPGDYGKSVIENTLSMLVTLTDVEKLKDLWDI